MNPAIQALEYDFVDALEFLDPVIQDRSQESIRLYVDKIKRGSFELGQGIVKNKFRFYSNLDDQSGMTSWRSIQLSRQADGEDPGFNGCTYDPKLVNHGFEKLEWGGHETSRRTEDVCLKDIKYKWQFNQQLNLMFGFLADITLQVWEQFARETYLKYAAAEGQIYVLGDGSPDAAPLSATYDPFTSSDMTIPRVTVGKLGWDFLTWWQMHFSLQVPKGAMGMKNGERTYGLVIHPFDVQQMIDDDPVLRQDYRDYSASVLIDGMGSVKWYRHWAIIPDNMAPRFNVKTVGASTLVLERVAPFTTQAITVGNRQVVNPAYLNAQYALGVIFLDKVFQVRTPPAGPVAPGGKTQFGAQPNLMGEFNFLNIQDRETNLLKEIGFFFGRYEAFDEPLEYSNEAVAFIYKRCPGTVAQLCEPCDGGTSANKTITAASRVVLDGETASLYTQVSVTLDTCLDCESPATIGVDYGGGTSADVTGIIVSDVDAPTYIIGFATAADYVSGSTIVADTSQLDCS
jgi:hypothetical protein